MSEKSSRSGDTGRGEWVTMGRARAMGAPLYAMHTAVVQGEIRTQVVPGEFPRYLASDVVRFLEAYREFKARSRRPLITVAR